MTKGKKDLHFIEHPDDLKTEKARDALTGAIADHFVDLVNAKRKALGKPPLK